MNEKLINDIYDNVKNILLNGIPLEYQNDVLLGYKKNLLEVYSKIDVNSNYELAKEALIEIEVSKWKDTTAAIRLSEFVMDKAMDDIRYISNNGFKYAQARINQSENDNVLPATIEINKCEEAKLMLEKLLTQVKGFNEELARYYVSEGILDFEFASGMTNDMSLRIGRIFR